MREIRFRAWDKFERTIIPWENIVVAFEDGCLSVDEAILIDEKSREYKIREIEEFELMQYTGLKDRNGKEIYEGDIYHQGDKNIKYLVVWHDTGLIGKQVGSSSYAGLEYWKDKIEVIGNIYEDPELGRYKNGK